MQRPMYPTKTPPLHHPVPQKPVQVPVMHSPPPPPSTAHSYNSPYDNPAYGGPLHPSGAFSYPAWPGPGPGPGAAHPMAGNFLNDPAAAMGISVAKAAMFSGGDYAEKNVYIRPPPPLLFALFSSSPLSPLSLPLSLPPSAPPPPSLPR